MTIGCLNYSSKEADISYSEESSRRLSDAVKQSVSGVEYAAAVTPPGWFAQNTLSVNRNYFQVGPYHRQGFTQHI